MAEAIYIASQLFKNNGITALFTSRNGGISPAPFDSLNFGFGLGDPDINIEENLGRLSKAAGLALRPHQVSQVHGSELLWFRGEGKAHPAEADILLTDEPGTALAVRTADCLPILLADPKNGICAAVHAGWRGTVDQAAVVAVKEMQAHGANPRHILASLGPCIGPCCFSIGEDVRARLSGCATGAEAHVRKRAAITADLQQINRLQLHQCGLAPKNIEHISGCTACDRKRFFSYRRDGKRSGRHLAIVAMPWKP